MKHFISYPFWINEVACWSDLKSLNGPVGTENRGVAVFTHRDITQLIESTFENPAHQKFFIHFFIDISNVNFILYNLSCPKLNSGQLKV